MKLRKIEFSGPAIYCTTKEDIMGDTLVCKVEDTWLREAKYWLSEAGAPITPSNIDEVSQAMDEAGEKKAQELAEG